MTGGHVAAETVMLTHVSTKLRHRPGQAKEAQSWLVELMKALKNQLMSNMGKHYVYCAHLVLNRIICVAEFNSCTYPGF